MNTATGQLYILSAPSGTGKSSLLQALRARLPAIDVAVSHTTRQPRSGEQDGVHYHFTTVEEFQRQIAADAFLEYAQVFDNFYGTSKAAVNSLLATDHDVILEIDWQGAQLVRQRAPDAISIFILPPSVAALQERLQKRGQDSEATIQRRMRDAQSDMAHYVEYDYLIINDNFETAVTELCSIFSSHRLQRKRQAQRYATLLRRLLA